MRKLLLTLRQNCPIFMWHGYKTYSKKNMNTRKHSKTLEKSRSWSQVNCVLIALGFSLTCAQAQTVTAPNSSNNQAATQTEINRIVNGLVAQVPVPEIALLQSLYDTAKTGFVLRSAELNQNNQIIDNPSSTPAERADARVEVIRLERERTLLGERITTLNPFVTETVTAAIPDSDIKLTAGVGRLQTGVAANNAQLKTIQDSVANYNGGIALSPNLEGTIDALQNTRVGDESGYQTADRNQVRTDRQNFEDNPDDITALRNYANSVVAQLQGYAPLNLGERDQLVGEVLNGSWERTAINALDGKITTAIATEVTDRNTAIGTAIATEVTDRDGAIAKEALIREDMDLAEAGAREDADKDLSASIHGGLDSKGVAQEGAIPTEVKNRNIAIKGEADRAKAAEQTLNVQLNGGVDAAGVTQVGEVARAKTAENTLGGRIDDEAIAREDADTALGGRITTEVTARGNADTALGLRITGETTDRVAAIDAERTARIAAINAEADRATAAERAITSKLDTHTLQLADHSTKLASHTATLADHGTRLISVESNIQRLNRGIAMTAALVTPTIESGNNNAVAFTAAGYEGDTGFSLGYARRISGGLSAHLAVASSDQFEETVVRGGVNFSW